MKKPDGVICYLNYFIHYLFGMSDGILASHGLLSESSPVASLEIWKQNKERKLVRIRFVPDRNVPNMTWQEDPAHDGESEKSGRIIVSFCVNMDDNQ
mmetsp:Transcript_24229/g.45082  ORF Transcript_24229/g.45082 Transcript_24229/m.45082 type:complete len:97 (+) Transcript_24229:1319-1609(+)